MFSLYLLYNLKIYTPNFSENGGEQYFLAGATKKICFISMMMMIGSR